MVATIAGFVPPSTSTVTPFECGITMNLAVTMDIEGGTKPAMVATVVYRRYL